MCDICACWFCFSSDPHDEDPRRGYANRWQIRMADVLCSPDCGYCFFAGLCLPCANYQVRARALNYDFSKYSCCQSYVDCCGFNDPSCCCAKSCPQFCLAMESCFCPSCATNATRFMIMDRYSIVSDPCDNRIIRFNNCVQLIACVLDIIGMFVSEVRDASLACRIFARLVYLCTSGCMLAQMRHELKFRESVDQVAPQAPGVQMMTRQPGPPPPGKVAPPAVQAEPVAYAVPYDGDAEKVYVEQK